jgi:hypothetical protein
MEAFILGHKACQQLVPSNPSLGDTLLVVLLKAGTAEELVERTGGAVEAS